MSIVGLETRRPYFRMDQPLKPSFPALRQTEHSQLVSRIEGYKKEIVAFLAQIAKKDRQINLLTTEVERLRSQLESIVPALTEKIGALEGTVAEKTYAMQAGRFVPPTL